MNFVYKKFAGICGGQKCSVVLIVLFDTERQSHREVIVMDFLVVVKEQSAKGIKRLAGLEVLVF